MKKLYESMCCLTKPLTLRKAGRRFHLSYHESMNEQDVNGGRQRIEVGIALLGPDDVAVLSL